MAVDAVESAEGELFFRALQLFADGVTVGVFVAANAIPKVDPEGDELHEPPRTAVQPCGDAGASVRGAERRQRGGLLLEAERRQGVLCVEPALGMRDDVDLFRPRCDEDFLRIGLQLRRIVFNGAEAVRIGRIDGISRLFEPFLDPAERLEKEELLDDDPVYENDRVVIHSHHRGCVKDASI